MHLKSRKQLRKQVITQKETYCYKQKKKKRASKIAVDFIAQRSAATFIWRFFAHSLFAINSLTVWCDKVSHCLLSAFALTV
jgi:hypothetical protein